MLLRLTLFFTVIFYCIVASAHDEIPGSTQKKPIVLKNARLYTVSHGIIENGTIVFDAGKILAVGSSVAIPSNAEIIDCQGKFVYPGFTAPSTTIGITELDAVRATNDLSETGMFNPNAIAATAYNPDSELIPTIRSNGILFANVIPTDGIVSGIGSLMMLDGWTKEDIAIKAKSCIAVNFPLYSVYTGPYARKTPDEQRKDNEKAIRALYDFFSKAKAYSIAACAGLADEAKDIRLEAMRSIFEQNLPVVIYANEYRQIIGSLDFARYFNLNVIIAGARDAMLCLDELKSSNASLIISRTHSLPMRDEDDYDISYILPSKLAAKEIKFAFSDDGSWQQRNLPFQAGSALAFGLSEADAIRALTLSPAEMFGISDRIGSLDVGKDATLFVSTGNALDGKSNNVELAYVQGRVVSLKSRQTELAHKYRTRYQQR